MPINIGTLTMTDGSEFEYATRAGGTIPMVLVHGYADSWYSFKGVLDHLPPEFACVAISLAGHGGSYKSQREYTVPSYARDVLNVMDRLKIDSAIIVGHSMGSFIAQEIALLAPTRVTKLVLIATAISADTDALREFAATTTKLSDPVPQAFAQDFQGGTCVNPVDPAMSLDQIVAESMKLSAHVWYAALKGLIAYRPFDFDSRNLLQLRQPTLVLGGALDEIFALQDQKKLACALPDATLQLDPTSGHSVLWERPAQTAQQIADFALLPTTSQMRI